MSGLVISRRTGHWTHIILRAEGSSWTDGACSIIIIVAGGAGQSSEARSMADESRLTRLAVRRSTPPVIVSSSGACTCICSFEIRTFFAVLHTG